MERSSVGFSNNAYENTVEWEEMRILVRKNTVDLEESRMHVEKNSSDA